MLVHAVRGMKHSYLLRRRGNPSLQTTFCLERLKIQGHLIIFSHATYENGVKTVVRRLSTSFAGKIYGIK